ncbi:hypothetical protein AMTRI_Chr04g187510 [Amborella trichopoda]
MTELELKVKQLLEEVAVDYSTTGPLEDAIAAITQSLRSISSEEKVGFETAPKFIEDLGVQANKVKFTFRKPEFIVIGGSYSFKAVARPYLNVDILIRMPKTCFHEKDYLNHRYHAKRCLYLCIIKKHLELCPTVRKIEWSAFRNEARKPILIVHPDVECGVVSEFGIRIIPTAPSLFDTSHLSFNRNNVRAFTTDGLPQATPNYNCSILEDMFLEEDMSFIKQIFMEWKDLREGLLLLKVWARNRSSIYIHDCLNGFIISAILSYLTTESGGKRINHSMTPIQIFRVTLDFIASSKVWDKGLHLHPSSWKNMSEEERKHLPFAVFFGDSSGYHNLAFQFTRSAFLELRDEAAWTLGYMDKYRDSGFEDVFLTKIDFTTKFDYCMRITCKRNCGRVCTSGLYLDKECWRVYEEKVQSLLAEGLTDRANVVRVTWGNTPSDWLIEDGFSKFGDNPLLVGIRVSSLEKAFRMVDVGPSADNKEEAVKFRKFWGQKAELRRFKDGRISESTVWECRQWEKHLIIKRICEYVFSLHLSLSKDDMIIAADQLDFSLLHSGRDPVSFTGDMISAFDSLSKRLRSLEDLPLHVSSVQPLDSAFRQTSVFPPEPHYLAKEKNSSGKSHKFVPSCIQPLEVMIQLEGSGNWPMAYMAVEKTKCAFLLKIAESLQKRWGMMCVASKDEVNVLMAGYAFSLRILHERDPSLLKKPIGNVQTKDFSPVKKDLLLCSRHSSMLNGFQGLYPMFGPVVRLAKRWVSSHLFSANLVDEAIELLVAYLFLKPFPFHAPCSRVTGFLRFLRLLSEYDWDLSPLIVDINGELILEDIREINNNFIQSRKPCEENGQTRDRAMFLATSYDRASESWTKLSPTTQDLRRIASYARSSVNLLSGLIEQGGTGARTWESLFRTPLKNYDAVILLHGDRLPYPQRVLFLAELKEGRLVIRGRPSKNFQPYISQEDLKGSFQEARRKLMVNFDPTWCFLEDIKREFPDDFKVWYDSLGGNLIGLTLEKLGPKKRKREGGDEEGRMVDKLRSIGEVGKGFVKSVHVLKIPRS